MYIVYNVYRNMHLAFVSMSLLDFFVKF